MIKANPEYILCEKCNVYIRILTTRKDGTYLYPPHLSACPQCGSKKLKEITREKYDDIEMEGVLWILVSKKYGRKTFKFSLKFNELNNGISCN